MTSNGECAHVCTNSIGSYVCSCRKGYDLADDFHGCDGKDDHLCHNPHFIISIPLYLPSIAQPCSPQLNAPQNGSIWCTGDQVTDQNCSFTCDAGFAFTGSELRECLSNNSWTGIRVACIPKHCELLTNPPNGYIDIENDCDTVLTTSCEIKCVEGYYINDTTPYYQTCTANQTSGDLYWTVAPNCECE